MEKLSQELLRYGKIITDQRAEVKDGFLRARFIEYMNVIYIHIMVNGEIKSITKFGEVQA